MSNIDEHHNNQYLIKNIARDMYLPGSEHLARIFSFGKNPCSRTIHQKKQFIDLIIRDFGEENLSKLRISDIENFLIKDKHSGSWKNFYLDIFGEIYTETIWKCDKPINKPKFMRFARNTRKADVFTTDELNSFLCLNNWKNYRDYLLFLCIASCGLRIGEARALKVNQLLSNDKFLLINGFCLYNGVRTNYNKKGSAADKKIRVAPLPDDTYQLLKNYIAANKLSHDDFIFRSKTLNPLTQKYLENIFKKQTIKAGIAVGNRKLVPHSLRYTYVTRMRRDLNVEQVQKIVGHTSIEMTEYYTRNLVDNMVASLSNTTKAVNQLFK